MSFDLDRAIRAWLEEDIGAGDHTTRGTIPPGTHGRTRVTARQDGIIAGLEAARRIFALRDSSITLELPLKDGEEMRSGDTVLHATGPAPSLLESERLVLNVLQRMSGIATSTRRYVERVRGTGARILDTRKTTPGFRFLEKEAVRLGGGMNHRYGLFDRVLIKDNHIDFAGGIRPAVEAVRRYLERERLDLPVEVEVRSLSDLDEVMRVGGIDRVLLDNFTPAMTRDAVRRVGDRFETESSGGITLENVRDYAECGVDFVSVGALTHQVRSLDLSMTVDLSPQTKPYAHGQGAG